MMSVKTLAGLVAVAFATTAYAVGAALGAGAVKAGSFFLSLIN